MKKVKFDIHYGESIDVKCHVCGHEDWFNHMEQPEFLQFLFFHANQCDNFEFDVIQKVNVDVSFD